MSWSLQESEVVAFSYFPNDVFSRLGGEANDDGSRFYAARSPHTYTSLPQVNEGVDRGRLIKSTRL